MLWRVLPGTSQVQYFHRHVSLLLPLPLNEKYEEKKCEARDLKLDHAWRLDVCLLSLAYATIVNLTSLSCFLRTSNLEGKAQATKIDARQRTGALFSTSYETMKVKIKKWNAVATWRWDQPEDELCGICRVQYDGTCPTCKFPGDDCALS